MDYVPLKRKTKIYDKNDDFCYFIVLIFQILYGSFILSILSARLILFVSGFPRSNVQEYWCWYGIVLKWLVFLCLCFSWFFYELSVICLWIISEVRHTCWLSNLSDMSSFQNVVWHKIFLSWMVLALFWLLFYFILFLLSWIYLKSFY